MMLVDSEGTGPMVSNVTMQLDLAHAMQLQRKLDRNASLMAFSWQIHKFKGVPSRNVSVCQQFFWLRPTSTTHSTSPEQTELKNRSLT